MSQLPFLLSNCSISKFIKDHDEPYEGDLLQVLQGYLKDGGVFIDVGAHVGNHTIAILQNTPAEVIAFEPNSDAFKALAGNVLALGFGNRVEINKIAVGEKISTGSLSPIYPGEAGSMSLLAAVDGGQTVDIVNLDSLLSKLGNRKPAVIKVDTEGYELFVVKGAVELIQTLKPVLCLEMSSVEQFDVVVKFMADLSYMPVSIFNATPTLIWLFDENAAAKNNNNVSDVYRYAIKMALEKNTLAANSSSRKAQVGGAGASSVLGFTPTVVSAVKGAKAKGKAASSLEVMSALKGPRAVEGGRAKDASKATLAASTPKEKGAKLAEENLLKTMAKSQSTNAAKGKIASKSEAGASKVEDVFDIVKRNRQKK